MSERDKVRERAREKGRRGKNKTKIKETKITKNGILQLFSYFSLLLG